MELWGGSAVLKNMEYSKNNSRSLEIIKPTGKKMPKTNFWNYLIDLVSVGMFRNMKHDDPDFFNAWAKTAILIRNIFISL